MSLSEIPAIRRQAGLSDCGPACLATLLNLPLERAHEAQDSLGLTNKHGYSAQKTRATNGKDLVQIAEKLGVSTNKKIFRGWEHIEAPSVVRVSRTRNGCWHWVAAMPSKTHGVVAFDPATGLKGFLENPPQDELCFCLEKAGAFGTIIELESTKRKRPPNGGRKSQVLA